MKLLLLGSTSDGRGQLVASTLEAAVADGDADCGNRSFESVCQLRRITTRSM
jgi:hypothetical protein